MRNALVVFTVLCIGGSMLGCSKNKAKPSPQGPQAPVVVNQSREALGWTLKFQSKCPEAVDATECVGQYGFTMTSAGKYSVGPGPAGELRSGELRTEETNQLATLLAATLNNAGAGLSLLSAEEKLDLDTAESLEDSVTLSRGAGEEATLIRTAGKELFYTVKSSDEAKALYVAARSIAQTYYAPLPFPDSCEDGLLSLKALVSTVETCSTDTDCAYFDPSLDVVPETRDAYLESDNCSRVLPVVVGNKELVGANKDKLLSMFAGVQQACGSNLFRNECTARAGISLPGPAATCQSNKCVAPASAPAPAPAGNPTH